MVRFECKLNDISIPEIFSLYEEVVPNKNKEIKNYYKNIEYNWNLMLESKGKIGFVLSCKNPVSNRKCSLSFWRSTMNGWVGQQLISNGFTEGVYSLLLRVQEMAIDNNIYSIQNWFRPDNKYTSKLFQLSTNQLGSDKSFCNESIYINLYPSNVFQDKDISIIQCTNNNHNNIYDFISDVCGEVYAKIEELHKDDIELENLHEIYQQYNLARKRFLFLAYQKNFSYPVGAAIVYRGPFGVNVRLIENQCKVFIKNHLDIELQRSIFSSLLYHCKEKYTDFPVKYIPISINRNSAILEFFDQSMVKNITTYFNIGWIDKGFTDWYSFVDNYNYFKNKKI